MIGGGAAALAVAILVAVLAMQGMSVEPAAEPVVEPAAETALEAESAHSQISLVEIFEMSEAGVVRITVHRNETVSEPGSMGSGIVFNKMGHIVTNAHVIEDAIRTEVTFLDGRAYKAEIVGADMHTDLAVVKVDADPELLMPLQIGDSGTLRVGEDVAAIGNPFGLSGSMTSGIVSQLDRRLPVEETGFSIPDVIQTDAAINPGNSGGPLLNMRGEVVGVNTAITTSTGQFAGVGFAIPSQTVVKIVPSLIADGGYDHPWIGVSGRDIDPALADALNLTDTRGFLIILVVDDSPASKAGLIGSNQTIQHDGQDYTVGGDIIIAVDDIEVRKISDILLHLQRSKAVGDEMRIQLLRDGGVVDTVLVLEKRPDRFD
ncbi:MAG: trypsin-like peptidase domain-containing protein [Nitrosopumilaceae archaeon]|nr:trypsin-like peptidase domain-containing protein [Nitrosopumilaceae archaeon]